MLRRALLVIVALAATISLVVEAHPAGAQATANATRDRRAIESEFVTRLNQLRVEHDLAPLVADPELTAVARSWAGHMARAGRISHRPDLTAAGTDPAWIKLGENVGVGVTVVSLHDAFVASPAHYRNLVDPGWQYVGIGVVVKGRKIYVAENFMEVETP